VHTLLDVVVSLLVSFILIWLSIKVFSGDTVPRKREFAISLVIILYAIAVIIISVVLYSNGTITQNYISDCLKAAGASIGFAAGMFIERIYIKYSVKSKSVLMQAIKFAAGIAGLLVIQEGLKMVIGAGLVVDMFRYFLMLIWVTVLFPLIIKRFFAVP